ncbi:MAG: hypothetical protein Q7S40_34190 [Opitutaceae bacterium]|nr:hypothetical protein [Opitutaceae bacterium]
MKINVSSINNRGTYEKEYVSLSVTADCDAGRFLLADTTYNDDGTVSSKLRHLFWLPDQKVKAGDFIWIHTKAGTVSTNANKAKTTTHHFYWGLKVSVWNDEGDCAILLHSDEWEFKRVA